MSQHNAAPPDELDGEIMRVEEDLRTWRKYNSDTWHDDPGYAAQARRLARLKRRRTRIQAAGT